MRALASFFLSALAGLALLGTDPAASTEIQPSVLLLVPRFEVDLDDPEMGLTTLFAVCNHDPGAVEVLATVHTNWGISLFETRFTLKHGAVGSFNLRDWLVRGALPDRTLSSGELAHVQAALSGRPSPANGFYYGTPSGAGLAVGYVTLVTAGGRLWGDYYEVDGRRGSLLAGPLVDLEPALCERHAARFLNNPAVAGGTRLVVWTGRHWAPSPEPQPEHVTKAAGIEVYDEAGWQVEEHTLPLLAADIVEVDDLRLQPGFGWLEIETGEPSFVVEHVRTLSSAGAALQAWCLPAEPPPPGPAPVASLAFEAMVNGEEADSPPGPDDPCLVPSFSFRVKNTGNVQLVDVKVQGNLERVVDVFGQHVICPQTSLEPGESMNCWFMSYPCRTCQPGKRGQRSAVATATARSPLGTVLANDPIHYFCRPPDLRLVLLTNGLDVAAPPGPSIPIGDRVTWTYVVTNTGSVDLSLFLGIPGYPVACPKYTLKPDETIVCFSYDTARAGQNGKGATVLGFWFHYQTSASDVGYYFGVPQ